MINMFDALPMAITCLTFLFLSKYWMWVCLGGAILTYTATIAAFFCPESPRWHLVNGRTSEAIKVLNEIARINGVEERIPSDTIFVEDPTNYETTVDEAGNTSHSFISESPSSSGPKQHHQLKSMKTMGAR